MRLVLVNPYLGPVPGGIEKEVIALANEFVRQGDNTAIVTTPYEFPSGEMDPTLPKCYSLTTEVQVLRLQGAFRSHLWDFQSSYAPLIMAGLVRAVRRQRPEAVIFFNIGWPFTIGPAILRLRRQSLVLYRTAYHPPLWRELQRQHEGSNGQGQASKGTNLVHTDSKRSLGWWRRRMVVKTANLSHQLVAFSHCEKAQLMRDGGISEPRITVIYSGADVTQPPPDQVAGFRTRHGLVGKCLVGHVGRLGRYKGTDTLIQLLPALRAETGRDVVLLLVGRNLEPDFLGSLIQQSGVEEQVKFLGAVSEEELRLAYAASDLFALPSRYESFGLVFLEAWAQGVPVIGCATGGVPELIRHGENGYLLDHAGQVDKLRDYLIRLISNEDLRKQMGQKGQARVQAEFTWPQCARRFKELIQHLQEEQSASCKS
jgi:glycosyltransferase involved in cell wall biosynthesis